MALLLALASGCAAPTGSIHAALRQDLGTLRREIEREGRAGELDRDRVVELGRAVASRELASAPEADAVQRVRSSQACASGILEAIEARAERRDEAAAEATLLLLRSNRLRAQTLYERYAAAEDGAWRAVAARSALQSPDFVARRAFFVDPDPRVRRAALEAAVSARDSGDLGVLLESVRVDPDALARSRAARAAGEIGGEASVLGLLDRFGAADEGTRLAIVDAWSRPASLAHGGARELRRVAEADLGMVSIAAAHALATIEPGEPAAAASALLAHAIEHGSDAERVVAIQLAPPEQGVVLAALIAAAKDENPEVAVAASSRLSSVPAEQARARRRLLELGRKSGAPGHGARVALAELGDQSVLAGLREDVKRGSRAERRAAALALFALGDAASAATAFADPYADVRADVACGIVARR